MDDTLNAILSALDEGDPLPAGTFTEVIASLSGIGSDPVTYEEFQAEKISRTLQG